VFQKILMFSVLPREYDWQLFVSQNSKEKVDNLNYVAYKRVWFLERCWI